MSLVNDYEIILRGLHSMLGHYADRVRVVEHETGGTAARSADIALFDTFPGRRDALDRAARMVEEQQVDHVVLYTWDTASEFLDIAASVGVAAVVLKSTSGGALVDVLERVAGGERIGLDHVGRAGRDLGTEAFSVREREVLALLALGRSNAQIARELFLSIDTIKTYVRRVFTKLGVNNRTQAALLAAGYDVGPPTLLRHDAAPAAGSSE